MAIKWLQSPDEALEVARSTGKPLFLNFSDTLSCPDPGRASTDIFANPRVSEYLGKHFLPVKIQKQENPEAFRRYDVRRTPSVLLLDEHGQEHYRIVGRLPVEEFLVQSDLGRAHIAFAHEDWEAAERIFISVYWRNTEAGTAAEALYWSAVAHYRRTRDARSLGEMTGKLLDQFPRSIWARLVSSYKDGTAEAR